MKLCLRVFACFLIFVSVHLATAAIDPSWTKPVAPFRIAGNLYYVGTEELTAFLIATPEGNILINSTLEQNVPLIEKNIETLGFHLRDTKILLISHAHYDHCAGNARILHDTGARYFVMAGDVPTIESGGTTDFLYAKRAEFHFPSAHVDRVLHDGDQVKLGGTTLTAVLTAGHTPGTTTWTFDEPDAAGKPRHVVIVGSPYANPGTKFSTPENYPHVADDFKHEFEVLKKLPCDIFLGAHGGYFGLTEKRARLKAGDANAFVDPAGYQAFVAERERDFQAELKHQLQQAK